MHLSRRKLFAVTPSALTAAALPLTAATPATPQPAPISRFEAQRSHLETVALQRLGATQHCDPRWSFLFETEGSYGLCYVPWTETESDSFDRDFDDLKLAWEPRRLWDLENGLSEPTEEELHEWRRARCISRAHSGNDYLWLAHIVPLHFGRTTEGFALFLCRPFEDEIPWLEGVFETAAGAEVALDREGAIAKDDNRPAEPSPLYPGVRRVS